MAVNTLKRASGLSALALVIALAAVPTSAMAQEETREHRGRGHGEMSGDIGGGSAPQREARAEQREARAEQRQVQAQARVEARAQAEAAPTPRSNGGGNPGGGWRNRGNDGATQVQVQTQAQAAPRWGSQRPADGERRGRDWSNGGEVSRPAPAWRGATPATPERGAESAQRQDDRRTRNGTYGDPNRGTTYRDGRRDDNRTGSAWTGDRTSADQARRDDNRYRDGDRNRDDSRYRDGHHSDDGNRWSGNDRNGYRNDHRRWDHNDWRRDNRYNWSGYRNQHRSIFRIGGYYSPYRNYYYRPLSIGFFLDSLFYSDRYWINDPWQYRLPEVYGPYRWIRYYDDVLLVDIYSGEVVDVIHNFFY